MTPQSFLAQHLKNLGADVSNALRAFIERPTDATMQVLLAAVGQHDVARAAAAAVEAADTRIYDAAGRFTGSHRPRHHTAPGALAGAAAEPGAYDVPKLATKRTREI
jgi:hypothetical protein